MEIDQQNRRRRIVLVSNRLPVVFKKNEQEQLEVRPGSGGLVTALAPLLRNRGGVWIGWPGIEDADEPQIRAILKKANRESGFTLCPLFLTKKEVQLYYEGFSNEIIWPLFHDLQSQCNFVPEYWEAYQAVNEKFADLAINSTTSQDFIWVHDYHLLLLAQMLRKKNLSSTLGFFLHIPFPPLDIFIKLPWRFEIIRSLLEYDLVGFQTMRDRRNFIQCVRMLRKDVRIESRKGLHHCIIGDREVKIGAFPISIDYKTFSSLASSKEVEKGAWHVHEKFPNQKMVFSLDRLDYTKGIPYRLEAIRTFLQKHPDKHKKVTFIQVVVPSRIEIPKYKILKEEIDRLVGEINSQFSKEGWVPIHYLFQSFNHEELLSFYRTSEVCLITSLKDGMNLVSKEYIACDIEEKGVLILSEFAGAASQLEEGALLINPYDIEKVAEAIFRALSLPEEEKKKRMRKMRRNTKRFDIFWWLDSFLNAAFQKDLVEFPLMPEYIPQEV